jgi:hypothetical protein
MTIAPAFNRPTGMTAFNIVWAGQLVSVLASSMTQFTLTIDALHFTPLTIIAYCPQRVCSSDPDNVSYDNLFEISFPYSMGFHQDPFDDQPLPEWKLHAHFIRIVSALSLSVNSWSATKCSPCRSATSRPNPPLKDYVHSQTHTTNMNLIDHISAIYRKKFGRTPFPVQ